MVKNIIRIRVWGRDFGCVFNLISGFFVVGKEGCSCVSGCSGGWGSVYGRLSGCFDWGFCCSNIFDSVVVVFFFCFKIFG